MDWGQLLVYGGAVVALVSTLAVGLAWGRGSTMKSTNEMLEKAIHQEREQPEAVERRCNERIAVLENEIAVLTERLQPRG